MHVDKCFDLGDLLGSHCGKVRKVEAALFTVHKRACLLDVGTEHSAKRCLQKVRDRVVARDGFTVSAVDARADLIADLQTARYNGAKVQIDAVGFFSVAYGEFKVFLLRK